MGWWAHKTKMSGAPFAQMFLYSQLVEGDCNSGTDIRDSLDILMQAGIPSASAYQPMQKNLDCTLHAASDTTDTNAAEHRIDGYETLPLEDRRQEIMSALASGHPVVLGINVYDNVANADPEHLLIDAPREGEQTPGGHAVAAFAYDAKGVWILNSWTSNWGRNGWAELSWEFITGSVGDTPNMDEGQVINGVVKGP
jgi:hypothetical protein